MWSYLPRWRYTTNICVKMTLYCNFILTQIQ